MVEALRDDNINMVGLYGMGGVGKTTLAKALGIEVQKLNIFDEVVMAIVSGTLIIKSIQDQIAESLKFTFTEQTELERAKQLYMRFTKPEKKILIILDDVWEYFDLKTKIGIPFGESHKGCKVLLTTRFEKVCVDMRCDRKFHLNILNEKEEWDLFKKHAGTGVDSPTLNALAIKIVRECKGLPLALVTIGSALREKDIEEYKLMYQKLKKSKLEDIQYHDVGIYTCIKSSYDFLKSEQRKLCFLLCSLFPEDSEISLEELVKYGIRLGLYEDGDSIEDARIQLSVTVKELKASCLLLHAKTDRSVKMHDIVRDVALCIASKEKKLLGKAGMGLTEWPKDKSLDQYLAISLIGNNIELLPDGLTYPNLRFLLLGVKSYANVSNQFFKDMKALEVLTLRGGVLSLKSLQFLTNLQSLQLENCRLKDISSLGKLDRLEILSLKDSSFDELPEELGNLSKLRLLDLSSCSPLKKWFPSNVLRRLSQLEELYMGGVEFIEGEAEGTAAEGSKASLSEFNSLSRLGVLTLDIRANCLQKDFAFRKFQRYDITVNYLPSRGLYPEENCSNIKDIAATSLTTFKALYRSLEHLYLSRVTDCQNILPTVDQGGLNELKTLDVDECKELEHVIDMTRQQFPANVFSKLEYLSLKNLSCLKETCYGGNFPGGFLQKLKEISLIHCPRLNCFLSISIARGFVQLEELTITDAPELKQVFYLDGGREGIVVEDDGKDIVLPKLRKLTFNELRSLTNFLPESYHSTLPALEELRICKCSNLNASFISEVRMQDLNKKLRVLEIEDCHHELCDGLMLTCLRHGFKNLEELRFKDCGVKMAFHLEGLLTAVDGQQQELVLPNLKKVILKSLTSLEGLVKGPTHHLSLQNLATIDVRDCHRLRYIFSSLLGQNMLQLKELYIEDCGELEQIILEEDHIQPLSFPNLSKINVKRCNKLKHLFRNMLQFEELYIEDCGELEQIIVEEDHIQPLPFLNLSKIDVKRCNKLKHLFPITIAQSLQKLEYITLVDNSHLEEIFGYKDGDDDMDDKEIVLPQLKGVSFRVLPNFTNFCSTYYHFALKLDSLSMEGCQDWACAGILTSFRDVKDLKIMDCEIRGLQGLYEGHTNVLRLQNLTRISITQCHKLSHVFSPTLVQNLWQLKELYIEGCEKLEHIIVKDDEEEHLQSQEVSRYKDGVDAINDKEIIGFPQLKKLILKTLPSFISFCLEDYHYVMKLETLSIGGFHDEGDRLWAGIFSYLRDVKELYIWDCGVKELKGLWKGTTHIIINLQNLTLLNFSKCSQLRHIFSPTLSQSLLQLRQLYVSDCEELEQIIVEDDEEDHLQPLLFPNLSKIDVRRCNKIKRVFSIIIAKSLQQLQHIYVEDNSQLEEVFGHRDGAEVMDDKAIVLPQLQRLYLKRLQSLTNFCHVGYHFIFPSLKNGSLVVERCGQIATRFSMDENESVHAEAKPPKEGSKDDEEATVNIDCYVYHQFWGTLPPYVET